MLLVIVKRKDFCYGALRKYVFSKYSKLRCPNPCSAEHLNFPLDSMDMVVNYSGQILVGLKYLHSKTLFIGILDQKTFYRGRTAKE